MAAGKCFELLAENATRRQLKFNILRNRLREERNPERLSQFIYLELKWTNRPQIFIFYELNDQRNDVNNA